MQFYCKTLPLFLQAIIEKETIIGETVETSTSTTAKVTTFASTPIPAFTSSISTASHGSKPATVSSSNKSTTASSDTQSLAATMSHSPVTRKHIITSSNRSSETNRTSTASIEEGVVETKPAPVLSLREKFEQMAKKQLQQEPERKFSPKVLPKPMAKKKLVEEKEEVRKPGAHSAVASINEAKIQDADKPILQNVKQELMIPDSDPLSAPADETLEDETSTVLNSELNFANFEDFLPPPLPEHPSDYRLSYIPLEADLLLPPPAAIDGLEPLEEDTVDELTLEAQIMPPYSSSPSSSKATPPSSPLPPPPLTSSPSPSPPAPSSPSPSPPAPLSPALPPPSPPASPIISSSLASSPLPSPPATPPSSLPPPVSLPPGTPPLPPTFPISSDSPPPSPPPSPLSSPPLPSPPPSPLPTPPPSPLPSSPPPSPPPSPPILSSSPPPSPPLSLPNVDLEQPESFMFQDELDLPPPSLVEDEEDLSFLPEMDISLPPPIMDMGSEPEDDLLDEPLLSSLPPPTLFPPPKVPSAILPPSPEVPPAPPSPPPKLPPTPPSPPPELPPIPSSPPPELPPTPSSPPPELPPFDLEQLEFMAQEDFPNLLPPALSTEEINDAMSLENGADINVLPCKLGELDVEMNGKETLAVTAQSVPQPAAQPAAIPGSSDLLDDIMLQLQMLTEPQQEEADDEEEEDDDDGPPPPLPSCPPPALNESGLLLENTEPPMAGGSDTLSDSAATATTGESELLQNISPSLVQTQSHINNATEPLSQPAVLSDKSEEASEETNTNCSKPVEMWDMDEVSCWLTDIGLGVYADIFRENEIVGEHLAQLTREDIKDLGITKIGHLKTFRQRLEIAMGNN